MENLTPIQTEILKAFNQMSEKTSFTEFILAKKIRENIKLETKKKAGISLGDILAVTEELQKENIFYSLHINSVNEILIKKENASFEIPLEAKRRRQASEKSMSILTSGDLHNTGSKKTKIKKRNETKKINIHSNFEDLEE